MTLTRIASILVVLTVCAGLPERARGASDDARIDALVAVSRAALGGPALDRVRVLRIDGTISTLGLTGTGTAWQEMRGKRFAESSTTPPLVSGDGFDGTACWNQDGSGLFLSRRAGTIVVLDVRPGTPAAAAGIRAGDRIDSIDGKSVSAMSLQDVRQYFFGDPGTRVNIGITPKSGGPAVRTLVLRDFV